MPTLPASGYAVPVAPTVDPLPSAGTPYQTDRGATLDAFGGARAEALTRLGGQFAQAAERMESIQAFHDTVATDEQVNSFEERLNKLLYGDPSKPGDVGYMGLQGRNAIDAREPTRKAIDAVINEQRSKITNLRQQHMFDQQTRRYRNTALAQIGRHYDTQYNAWTASTAENTAKLAVNRGVVAANNNDFGGFKEALGAAANGLQTSMTAMGKPSEEVAVAIQTLTKNMATQWAKTRIEKDPVEAEKFIEENKDNLGDAYDDLLRAARTRSIKHQAQDIIAGKTPTRPSNLVSGDAMQRGLGQHISEAVKVFQEAGWTRAAIEGALANGLAEGTFGENWKRSTIPGEQSFGHWQFNAGGELPGFMRFANGDKSTAAQARYLVTRMEQVHPGYGSIQDARQATDIVGLKFERYKDARPGDRYSYLAAVQKKLGAVEEGVAAQTSLPAPDKLLSDLPPNEQGELPDKEVPGLMEFLQDRAKKIPADAPRELWWEVVKQARQMHNMQYSVGQQQERLRRQAQDKADHDLGGEYVARITSGQNVPSEAEIGTDKRISDTKRQNLIGFLRAAAKQDPPAAENKANHFELYKRLGLPEGDPERLISENQILEAATNKLISIEAADDLIKRFRDREGITNNAIQTHITRRMQAAEIYLWPIAAQMGKQVGLQSDAAGPSRLENYRAAVEAKVQEYRLAKKNPLDLFRPGTPEKPNPDFVGDPDFVKSFGRGAPGLPAQLKDSVDFNNPGDFKTPDELQGAYRAGKFGPVGSPDALMRARDYAIRKGFARPAESQAPVR